MNIVERIQLKVKEKGTSINALEKEAGISGGIIRRWNERSPQCDKIAPVADCLGVSLDWLVLGRESTASLSKKEEAIIKAYRATTPGIKESIEKLLDVQEVEAELEPESEVETSSEYKIG